MESVDLVIGVLSYIEETKGRYWGYGFYLDPCIVVKLFTDNLLFTWSQNHLRGIVDD